MSQHSFGHPGTSARVAYLRDYITPVSGHPLQAVLGDDEPLRRRTFRQCLSGYARLKNHVAVALPSPLWYPEGDVADKNRSPSNVRNGDDSPFFVRVVSGAWGNAHVPLQRNFDSGAVSKKIQYAQDGPGDAGNQPKDRRNLG